MAELVADGLLNSYLLTQTFERIFTLESLQFYGCILVQELVDGEEAASYFNLNLIPLTFHHYTS